MAIYQKLCAEFYDIDKPKVPSDAFQFLLNYAKQAHGPILDAMCGTGRFLIPLLEQSFDVDGVDASVAMLQACRAKCTAKGLSPGLYEQYLNRLDLQRRYDLIFIADSSFCLITDQVDVQRSLERFHAHLNHGGRLLLGIDLITARLSGSQPWSGRWVVRPDGAKIVISSLGHYQAETHVSQSILRYDLVRDGRIEQTEVDDFDIRCYDLAEFSDLLIANGFSGITPVKAYANRAPDAGDESVMIECRKA